MTRLMICLAARPSEKVFPEKLKKNPRFEFVLGWVSFSDLGWNQCLFAMKAHLKPAYNLGLNIVWALYYYVC